jgi:hypothetical protein
VLKREVEEEIASLQEQEGVWCLQNSSSQALPSFSQRTMRRASKVTVTRKNM